MRRWSCSVLSLAALLTLPRTSAAGEDAPPELAPFVAREPAPAAWTTDLAGALRRAQVERRRVLLLFADRPEGETGRRLRDEILTKKPFLDYAREALVLVEVDGAAGGATAAETPAEAAWREKLRAAYGVGALPAVVLVDEENRELGRTGYMEGGAKTFVRELKRIVALGVAKAAIELPREQP